MVRSEVGRGAIAIPGAPRGWRDSGNPRRCCVPYPAVRTTRRSLPRGFPSLTKEGNLVAACRERN